MSFCPPPKRSKPKERKTLLFAILTAPFSAWDRHTSWRCSSHLATMKTTVIPNRVRTGRPEKLVLVNNLELVSITGLCPKDLQTAYYMRKISLFLV